MISHLLIKPKHKHPMAAVDMLWATPDGIDGQVTSPPLRQVLLLEDDTLEDFNLQPGDLRENIIIRDFGLYHRPSGTVIQIGDVKIALTFHCEPCKIIGDKVNLKAIQHQRGYLGYFLNSGAIARDDRVEVLDERVEAIPYVPVERIKWYLNKIDQPIMASDLMWQVGLASSYCRALPALLRKHKDIDKSKVIFQWQLL
jgi:MOSC domain-containing protein YiiM